MLTELSCLNYMLPHLQKAAAQDSSCKTLTNAFFKNFQLLELSKDIFKMPKLDSINEFIENTPSEFLVQRKFFPAIQQNLYSLLLDEDNRVTPVFNLPFNCKFKSAHRIHQLSLLCKYECFETLLSLLLFFQYITLDCQQQRAQLSSLDRFFSKLYDFNISRPLELHILDETLKGEFALDSPFPLCPEHSEVDVANQLIMPYFYALLQSSQASHFGKLDFQSFFRDHLRCLAEK